MALNADMILMAPSASLGFPEVKRGVVALAGALPRLRAQVGRVRAMEMVLMGRNVGSEEARAWGLCNGVAGKDGDEGGGVVDMAVEWAGVVAGNSPDAVRVSKEGVELGGDGLGVVEATGRLEKGLWKRVEGGVNMRYVMLVLSLFFLWLACFVFRSSEIRLAWGDGRSVLIVNMIIYREGLRAFVEKREPRWVASKL